jgi:hypothetical protein
MTSKVQTLDILTLFPLATKFVYYNNTIFFQNVLLTKFFFSEFVFTKGLSNSYGVNHYQGSPHKANSLMLEPYQLL